VFNSSFGSKIVNAHPLVHWQYEAQQAQPCAAKRHRSLTAVTSGVKIAAFSLLLWVVQLVPAVAASDGDTNKIDWSRALWGGLIAAGLWVVANLAGQLWIRFRSARQKRRK
jgi:uncharacterized membrane protein